MYTKVTDIKNLHKNAQIGQDIMIAGWVRSIRDNKNFAFIDLNDGTFFKGVQVIFDNALNNFEEILKVGSGASLLIKGKLVESQGKGQAFEIKAENIRVEGDSPSDYPLQKKRHTLEYLRTIAHLRPRANIFMAAFRIRSLAAFAVHQFFNERGFVYLHSPIVTPFDAEGAGEMFKVSTGSKEEFFGKEAFLTVSGQLSAEAFAQAFKNVYTFGPAFRAENSNTTRHAAEFWMIEPEIAFADLDDNIELAQAMVKHIINYVLQNAKEEMEFLDEFVSKGLIERLTGIANADFAVISYTESIEILQKSGVNFEFAPEWGKELQTEHEKYLAEEVYKKPVFVRDYPKDVKAFYMRLNDDGKTVAATDLLVPGIGELIGGSQREERTDVLIKRMKEMNLDPEHYWWYTDLRKYGTTTHAGFGLGFERMIMYITGISNIRDVIPFPRTVNHIEF